MFNKFKSFLNPTNHGKLWLEWTPSDRQEGQVSMNRTIQRWQWDMIKSVINEPEKWAPLPSDK